LTEEFVRAARVPVEQGQIILAAAEEDSPAATWTRYPVDAFAVVDVEGAAGWTMRVSQRVLSEIRADVARHPAVETGGVLIGTCSARLRAVTVVDVLPAPPDSVRSAARFVLGTKGLRQAIKTRHAQSGATLFDVGTWHSHLADHGPSALDRKTAAELAAERPPPSALLIATPGRLYGLMHPAARTEPLAVRTARAG
jgi:proteasome lid subunit RPN8/RPN11